MKTYTELTKREIFTDAVTSIYNAECQSIGISRASEIVSVEFEKILDSKNRKEAIVEKLLSMNETEACLVLQNMFFQSKGVIVPVLFAAMKDMDELFRLEF